MAGKLSANCGNAHASLDIISGASLGRKGQTTFAYGPFGPTVLLSLMSPLVQVRILLLLNKGSREHELPKHAIPLGPCKLGGKSMTSSEILLQLSADPTERGIRYLQPMVSYLVVPTCLGNLDTVGHVAIEADDGLLMVPYMTVLSHNGWEQLDLSSSRLIERPPGWNAISQAYQTALNALDILLTDTIATSSDLFLSDIKH